MRIECSINNKMRAEKERKGESCTAYTSFHMDKYCGRVVKFFKYKCQIGKQVIESSRHPLSNCSHAHLQSIAHVAGISFLSPLTILNSIDGQLVTRIYSKSNKTK